MPKPQHRKTKTIISEHRHHEQMARIQDKISPGRSFIRNGEPAEGYAHPVSASSLASVVGLAIRALMSHNMEWHFRVGSTVVAQDPYLRKRDDLKLRIPTLKSSKTWIKKDDIPICLDKIQALVLLQFPYQASPKT